MPLAKVSSLGAISPGAGGTLAPAGYQDGSAIGRVDGARPPDGAQGTDTKAQARRPRHEGTGTKAQARQPQALIQRVATLEAPAGTDSTRAWDHTS